MKLLMDAGDSTFSYYSFTIFFIPLCVMDLALKGILEKKNPVILLNLTLDKATVTKGAGLRGMLIEMQISA